MTDDEIMAAILCGLIEETNRMALELCKTHAENVRCARIFERQ